MRDHDGITIRPGRAREELVDELMRLFGGPPRRGTFRRVPPRHRGPRGRRRGR